MLDFDQIVRNMLFEQEQQMELNFGDTQTTSTETPQTQSSPTNPPNPEQDQTNTSEEEQTKKESSGIFEFLTQSAPKPYDQLKTIWPKFKTDYIFCSEDELRSICYAVTSQKPRNTRKPESFLKLENTFPLLDLIALLWEQNFKKGNDPTKASETYKSFQKRLEEQLNKNKNLKPLDYVALDPWAQSVKSQFLAISKQELGKLRLDSLDKNFSIYQLVFNLLAIRKKAIFPKLSTFLKGLNGEGVVNKIMLEPWNVISGTYAIPDEKVKAMYEDLLVKEMIDVSIAAYKLFTQQALILGATVDPKNPDAKLYAAFIGKNGTAAVPWPIPTEKEPVNASFDQTFELLSKQLLGEVTDPAIAARIRSNAEASARGRMGSNFSGSAAAQDVSREIPATSDSSTEEQPPETPSSEEKTSTELRAFETKPGEFVYNFDTLKQAKNTFRVEEATNLLAEIEGLANYIKTRESRDILGGLNQIAKGMSLGVKNMGS